MKKRKIFLIIAIMLIFALVLSACGNNDPAAPAATTPAATAPAATDDSAGDEAVDVIEIEFVHFLDNPFVEEMTMHFAMFAEENPGYRIVPESFTGEAGLAALNVRIASGNAPDMWLTTSFGPGLAEFIDVAVDLSSADIWGNVSEAAQADVTYDGKKLAFPFNSNVYGLLYNVDVMNSIGVTEMPTTLSGLIALCEQLVAAGITPFALGFQDDWVGHQFFTWPMAFPFGDSISTQARVNEYFAGNAIPSEDGWPGKLVDMMQVVKDFNSPNPFSIDWPMMCQMLADGEVAMIIQGDWSESMGRNFNPDTNIAMALLPFSEDPADARIFVASAGRSILVSNDADPAVQEGAFTYFRWTSGAPSSINWYNQYFQNIAPFYGVMPEGNEVQILSSAAALIAANPDAVSPWTGELLPPGFFMLHPGTQEKFFAGEIDRDDVIRIIDTLFAQFQ